MLRNVAVSVASRHRICHKEVPSSPDRSRTVASNPSLVPPELPSDDNASLVFPSISIPSKYITL